MHCDIFLFPKQIVERDFLLHVHTWLFKNLVLKLIIKLVHSRFFQTDPSTRAHRRQATPPFPDLPDSIVVIVVIAITTLRCHWCTRHSCFGLHCFAGIVPPDFVCAKVFMSFPSTPCALLSHATKNFRCPGEHHWIVRAISLPIIIPHRPTTQFCNLHLKH